MKKSKKPLVLNMREVSASVHARTRKPPLPQNFIEPNPAREASRKACRNKVIDLDV